MFPRPFQLKTRHLHRGTLMVRFRIVQSLPLTSRSVRELTTFPEVVTAFFLYGISLHGSPCNVRVCGARSASLGTDI